MGCNMLRERVEAVTEVYVFTMTYACGAEGGHCDEVGSAEYFRVLQEYFLAGCPDDVHGFIQEAANRPPQQQWPETK